MIDEGDPLQRIFSILEMLQWVKSHRGTGCPYLKWLNTIGEADYFAELHHEIRQIKYL